MSRPNIVPDYAHYLTGYRAWNLRQVEITALRPRFDIDDYRTYRKVGEPRQYASRHFEWRLWSIGDGCLEWAPKKIVQAECRRNLFGPPYPTHGERGSNDSPVKDCHCGFHAYRSMKDMRHRLFFSPEYIYGKVALWGRIIEHEHGYRAEYAYPLEIAIPASYALRLEGYYEPAESCLLREYGVARSEELIEMLAQPQPPPVDERYFIMPRWTHVAMYYNAPQWARVRLTGQTKPKPQPPQPNQYPHAKWNYVITGIDEGDDKT